MLDSLLEYLYTGDYDEYKPISAGSEPDDQADVESESMESAGNTPPDATDTPDPLAPVPTTPAQGPFSASPPVPSQATNAIIYALGEQYHIPPLKALAVHNFASHAYALWARQLPSVLDLVYTTTPDTDRPLRELARSVCGAHVHALVALMLRVPGFGVDLCAGGLRHLKAGWDAERATVADGEEEMERLGGLAEAADGRAAARDWDLRNLVERVNKIGKCWTCVEHVPIRANLGARRSRGEIRLECSGCRNALATAWG